MPIINLKDKKLYIPVGDSGLRHVVPVNSENMLLVGLRQVDGGCHPLDLIKAQVGSGRLVN